jgi:hypothetical protein
MKTASVILMVLFFCAPAFAGEITGTVTYGDGSPCGGCKVSASIQSGGITDAVYADSHGNFRLTWSGSNAIEKLYVSGNTVATNIRSGEHVKVRAR